MLHSIYFVNIINVLAVCLPNKRALFPLAQTTSMQSKRRVSTHIGWRAWTTITIHTEHKYQQYLCAAIAVAKYGRATVRGSALLALDNVPHSYLSASSTKCTICVNARRCEDTRHIVYNYFMITFVAFFPSSSAAGHIYYNDCVRRMHCDCRVCVCDASTARCCAANGSRRPRKMCRDKMV